MRAGIARHILDEADHRHAGLVEQVDRAGGVDQREVLRGGDDHGPGGLMLLHHRQLHVAGAGRQVEHERVGRAPVRLDQLRQRARDHRPAPGERAAVLDQLPHRQHRHAIGRGDGIEHLVLRGRALALGGHQPWLRGAVDVGVDQPDAAAALLQGDGEVGGERRLADAALAARHRDQPAGHALGGDDEADLAGPAALGGGADLRLQRRARARRQAGRVEDDAGAVSFEAQGGAAAGGGADGGDRNVLCHGRADRGPAAAWHCFSANTLL